MADPWVRRVGHVVDIDGLSLPVGVDYDCVSIGKYRLTAGLAEEFARLFCAASWQAAMQQREHAEMDAALEADDERVTSLGGDDYDGPLTSGGSDGTYAENH